MDYLDLLNWQDKRFKIIFSDSVLSKQFHALWKETIEHYFNGSSFYTEHPSYSIIQELLSDEIPLTSSHGRILAKISILRAQIQHFIRHDTEEYIDKKNINKKNHWDLCFSHHDYQTQLIRKKWWLFEAEIEKHCLDSDIEINLSQFQPTEQNSQSYFAMRAKELDLSQPIVKNNQDNTHLQHKIDFIQAGLHVPTEYRHMDIFLPILYLAALEKFSSLFLSEQISSKEKTKSSSIHFSFPYAFKLKEKEQPDKFYLEKFTTYFSSHFLTDLSKTKGTLETILMNHFSDPIHLEEKFSIIIKLWNDKKWDLLQLVNKDEYWDSEENLIYHQDGHNNKYFNYQDVISTQKIKPMWQTKIKK